MSFLNPELLFPYLGPAVPSSLYLSHPFRFCLFQLSFLLLILLFLFSTDFFFVRAILSFYNSCSIPISTAGTIMSRPFYLFRAFIGSNIESYLSYPAAKDQIFILVSFPELFKFKTIEISGNLLQKKKTYISLHCHWGKKNKFC